MNLECNRFGGYQLNRCNSDWMHGVHVYIMLVGRGGSGLQRVLVWGDKSAVKSDSTLRRRHPTQQMQACMHYSLLKLMDLFTYRKIIQFLLLFNCNNLWECDFFKDFRTWESSL